MRTFLTLLTLSLAGAAIAQEPVEDVTAAEPDLYARDTYRIDTLVCPFRGRIDYEPGDIECGLGEIDDSGLLYTNGP